MSDALDLDLDLPTPRPEPPTAAWTCVLDVWVPGTPAPQGSVKAVIHKHSGRPVAIKTNNATQKSWRGDVRETIAATLGDTPPIDGPVRLIIDFVMPRPTSTPKRSTPFAIKRPDGDKLQRAIWDALTSAGVYRDDSQVVGWGGGKRLAELAETPGARIRVEVPV